MPTPKNFLSLGSFKTLKWLVVSFGNLKTEENPIFRTETLGRDPLNVENYFFRNDRK